MAWPLVNMPSFVMFTRTTCVLEPIENRDFNADLAMESFERGGLHACRSRARVHEVQLRGGDESALLLDPLSILSLTQAGEWDVFFHVFCLKWKLLTFADRTSHCLRCDEPLLHAVDGEKNCWIPLWSTMADNREGHIFWLSFPLPKTFVFAAAGPSRLYRSQQLEVNRTRRTLISRLARFAPVQTQTSSQLL